MSEYLLKAERLKKNYGAFTLDCSMEVPKGRITGIVGRNGAGKTTLFKAALGLIKADGGSVRILGKDPLRLTAEDKAKTGVALSDSGFNGFLKVRDVKRILKSFYTGFDEAYFDEQAEKMQLPVNKNIKEFSTGMKAKLKVLAAVTHGAELLIMDEPTAGLDVVARDELLEMLNEYMEKDENRAVVISSHISGDLEGLCDDIYMIDEGRIVLHEDTDVLMDSYAVLKVDEEQFKGLDKSHILRVKREPFGYSCLTGEKNFYTENCPGIVVERGGIDSVMTLMIKGEEI